MSSGGKREGAGRKGGYRKPHALRARHWYRLTVEEDSALSKKAVAYGLSVPDFVREAIKAECAKATPAREPVYRESVGETVTRWIRLDDVDDAALHAAVQRCSVTMSGFLRGAVREACRKQITETPPEEAGQQ